MQQIIDNWINGNKESFYKQVKEYGVYEFFDNVRSYYFDNDNCLSASVIVSMFIDYLYYDNL